MVFDFSPYLFQIGPIGLRYYSLAYLIGVFLTYLWLVKVAKYDREKVEEFAIYGFLAIILGGRLGEFLFYHPEWIWEPMRILEIWKGGMSFHGGLITVFLWTWYYTRKQGWDFLRFADNMVIPAAIGVGLSKIGNFFNGELWGVETDVAWCFEVPGRSGCRHPSQLYQALKNFLVAGLLALVYFRKPKKGVVTSLFLIGYGIGRTTIEIWWRDPDWVYWGITSGTWLSIPMVILGAILLVRCTKYNRS